LDFKDSDNRPEKDQRTESAGDAESIPFAGRYRILSCIGSGGMGAIYLAKHELMNRLVALKMLLPHADDDDPTSLARFRQEAQALSQLSHPNIVTVFDFGVSDEGIPFLAMEYIEGLSLAELLKNGGPLGPARLVHIVAQVCDALEIAHGRGVIHRDLKPSNLIVTNSPTSKELVKIVDFGLAKVFREEDDDSLQLTKAGECVGSPPYMSPEQCYSRPLDRRSDIYSMGCVIYEALAGAPPFSGGTYAEVAHKHCTQMPASLVNKRSDIKNIRALESVILKAMAKEPAKRFNTMLELKQALEQAAQEVSIDWFSKAKTLWMRRRN